VLVRPQRVIEYVLGGKDRLARSIWDGRGIWRLAGILLGVSLLAAIPYGVVSPQATWWKIAVLFTGSLVICFPSLHAFAQFFGLKLDLGRNFALSLIITATAALFTLGFFPIVWFIGYSISPGEGAVIVPEDLSRALLWLSLTLGLVQIGRCLADRNTRQQQKASLVLLFLLWTPLLIFITCRMCRLLGMM
jgi:hypothetical protein